MNEKQIKELLQSKGLKWMHFFEFMKGKTTSTDDNGDKIYWPGDVDRFIDSKINQKKQARVKVPNTMTLVEAGSVCGQTAGHAKIERYSIQMGLMDNDLENNMVTLIINEEA